MCECLGTTIEHTFSRFEVLRQLHLQPHQRPRKLGYPLPHHRLTRLHRQPHQHHRDGDHPYAYIPYGQTTVTDVTDGDRPAVPVHQPPQRRQRPLQGRPAHLQPPPVPLDPARPGPQLSERPLRQRLPLCRSNPANRVDVTDAVSASAGVQARYGVCVGAGVSFSGGAFSPYVEVGVGTPGAAVSSYVSSAASPDGVGTSCGCSAGRVSVGSGGVGGELGVGPPGCSSTVAYQF